ncbi:hypothetical protein Q5752_001516 [Cryptotrichosporon argae]
MAGQHPWQGKVNSQTFTNEIKRLQAEHDALTADLEASRAEIADRDLRITDMKAKRDANEAGRKKQDADFQVRLEAVATGRADKLRATAARASKAEQAVQNEAARAHELQAEVDANDATCAALINERDQRQLALDESRAEVGRLAEQFQAARNLLSELYKAMEDDRAKITHQLEAEAADSRRERESLRRELNEAGIELCAAEAKARKAQGQVKAKAAGINMMQAQLDESDATRAALLEERDDLQKKLEASDAAGRQWKEQLDASKRLEEEHNELVQQGQAKVVRPETDIEQVRNVLQRTVDAAVAARDTDWVGRAAAIEESDALRIELSSMKEEHDTLLAEHKCLEQRFDDLRH